MLLAFSAAVLSPLAGARTLLLPTTPLRVAGLTIQVELAATPQSRQQGLMFRTRLPPDHGMLFVFDQPEPQCFWMKNTPLPLSIAFIDASGTIVQLSDMQPYSERPHCSGLPVVYALEMERGWFARHGVSAGQAVEGLPQPLD